MAAQIGSVIAAANGNRTLGDVNSVTGFYSDGEIRINQNVGISLASWNTFVPEMGDEFEIMTWATGLTDRRSAKSLST